MPPTLARPPDIPPDPAATIEALEAEVASLRRALFLLRQVVDQEPSPLPGPRRGRPGHLRLITSRSAS